MTSDLAIIHTDGGARGNPGPSGIGAVIEFHGKQHLFKKYVGEGTNNQAEYLAVIMALEKAQELGVTEADVYLDSELVQQQLLGNYKVKNQELASLFVKVWNLQQHFKKVRYHHVLRGDNKLADKLVNEALDEKLA